MDPTESKERRGQRYICGMPPVQDANSAGPLVVNLLQTLEGHQGAVYDLCLDGQGALVSAGGDGLLVQWPRNAEAFNSQGKALAKAGSPVFSLRALPDGGLEAGTAGGELLTVMEDGDWQGRNAPRRRDICGVSLGNGRRRWSLGEPVAGNTRNRVAAI